MNTLKPTTEQSSNYDDLEKMTVNELLVNMNQEDKAVPLAIERAIPSIEHFVEQTLVRMKKGGRLFYIGAGTSGRLGILDASECPPTFGVSDDWIIGLIAGGDKALRKAVENAEDNEVMAWKDLEVHKINENDVLLGIAASGSTPYVVGGLKAANANGVLTGSISCNQNSLVSEIATCPMELVVGPEFVTGSTRMKAGTAQKLALNMISTSIMINLGRVKGNKMVDMQLSNNKLVDRGTKMIMEELGINESLAKSLLLEHGSVRKSIECYKQ
ncbi:N-acetylmuramic acid 6-phosphate etherase [Maribacter dokdonensis]|uniref:N-acetylmuramic acid 6-phosphate etherase n=1 Tax=Maribacter dokdonensis TaxID=320912 RepID=A0A1H4QG10_9FLAO|nr:N-acetylmuramic acid 6-phosphate etherase [Maribacter dokdonensis]SEC18544.1 N-acetylmuramic acid 6-phosphate etherase [Maribacter dokdonensis]